MDVDALNSGYASEILEQYLENPESVPSEWRALFESGAVDLTGLPGLARLVERLRPEGNGNGTTAVAPPAPAPAPATPDEELLGGVAAAMALVKAHRMHGHLAARLDPLGSEPVGDPALEPERLIPKLTPELQGRIPASLLRLSVPAETLADALPILRETYCGTIAYEIEHIADHERRVWLRQAIESGKYRRPLSADEQKKLLERLSEVEGFERYLRRAFLGQKQFSIEGLDVMIPMLDEAIGLVRRGGRPRGRDGHGAPRPAQRPRPHDRAALRGDPPRVRGRADDRGDRRRPRGRLRRRQVPPRRRRRPEDAVGRDHGHALRQPEPPGGGRPRGRGPHACRADRPLDARRRPRPRCGAPDPDPRRRVVCRPGRGRRDAQHRGSLRLLDRRHAPPDREQPDRLHHRSRRGPLDPLLERPGEGLRHPDHPRQRRRPGGGDLGDPARARVPPPLRARRRRRPRRLPPLRPQRAGRARLHPAADGRANRRAPDRPRAVRRAPRRGRRDHPGGGGRRSKRASRRCSRRRTSG